MAGTDARNTAAGASDGATSGFAGRAIEQALGWIGFGVAVEMPPESDLQPDWRAVALQAQWVAGCLLLLSVAFGLSRAGFWLAAPVYWIGALAMFAVPAWRAMSADCARAERIVLVAMVTVGIFLLKVLYAPTGFVHFDEFLHWVTANDIVETRRLFTTNDLLPISPKFPALEIVTVALADATGLSIFWAGTLLVGASRLLFVISFYCLIERLTRSQIIAACSTLVLMGNANFSLFHASFAYESLAVALLNFIMLVEYLDRETSRPNWLRTTVLLGSLLFVLAITHHVTASFMAGMLGLLMVLVLLKPAPAATKLRAVLVAVLASAGVWGWSKLLGDPTASYVGPVFEQAALELNRLLSGGGMTRRLFVSDDGIAQPMLRQLVMLGALLVVLAGLATGFLRVLTIAGAGSPSHRFVDKLVGLWAWRDPRLVLFALLTLLFPVGLILRLTAAGWEIGSRLGSLCFIGVAPVVAVAMICFWQGRNLAPMRRLAVPLATVLIFIGGVSVGWGPNSLPGGFQVSADAMSVEPTGISAALWVRDRLGTGWRFGTDRINRLLLAAYGRQEVVTTLSSHVDVSRIFTSANMGAAEYSAIRMGFVDYLMVDYRLTWGRPAMGAYFEKGEPDDVHARPISSDALKKFNSERDFARVFDSGALAVFDVRRARDGR